MLSGQKVALATKHGKEKVFSSLFSEIKCEIVLVPFDTDLFGTFSGEVAREKSPKATVLAKAHAAAETANTNFAVASEGSIGPHPQLPLITADIEWVAFVDKSRGIELTEHFVSTEIVAVQETWSESLDVQKLAEKANLPIHSLIARARTDQDFWSKKGIKTIDELNQAVADFQLLGWDTELIFESDFRAMESPTRMKNIELATSKLVSRLSTLCPECQMYGFGVLGYEFGLLCLVCGESVPDVIRAERLGCLVCSAELIRPREATAVEPSRCYNCNP